MMDRLLWHARRMPRSVGWPALAGVALLVLLAAFHLLTLTPLRQEVAEFKHEAESLRGKAALRRGVPVARGMGGQLAAFYAFFPGTDALTAALGKLYDAAAKQNLELDQGEYRLVPTPEGRLVRYDIVLPVKGSYTRLRGFIAQALRDNPSLALEGVNFNRQTAIDIGVDAQVRMTLYMRAAQP